MQLGSPLLLYSNSLLLIPLLCIYYSIFLRSFDPFKLSTLPPSPPKKCSFLKYDLFFFPLPSRRLKKAAEAAILARQWSKAVQIVEMQDPASCKDYFVQIATHFASVQDYEVGIALHYVLPPLYLSHTLLPHPHITLLYPSPSHITSSPLPTSHITSNPRSLLPTPPHPPTSLPLHHLTLFPPLTSPSHITPYPSPSHITPHPHRSQSSTSSRGIGHTMPWICT